MTRADEPEPCQSLAEWNGRECDWESPADRALAGGFAADRLGYAFAAGYQAAIEQLLGERLPTAAVCATERGGATPQAIETTLSEGRLNGLKTFVTGAQEAKLLVVFASLGRDDQGLNRLRAVKLPAHRLGISLKKAPPTPFVPEIPHAQAHFEQVHVEEAEQLPGDGYTDYLKPFRTVEDIHVHLALTGWLVQVGRRKKWAEPCMEQLLALLVGLRGLAGACPSEPSVHLALQGSFSLLTEFLEQQQDWLLENAPFWSRDRALLRVAQGVRTRRTAVAWSKTRLGQLPDRVQKT